MPETPLSAESLRELVLDSFEAERRGNDEQNGELLHEEFAATDMVLDHADAAPLPRLSGDAVRMAIRTAFQIEGREFQFKNVLADPESQTVMVEFVESYPDPETGRVYRTPQAGVYEIRDGRIYRTRHYMDPRLSHEFLAQEDIDQAFE